MDYDTYETQGTDVWGGDALGRRPGNTRTLGCSRGTYDAVAPADGTIQKKK